jgi:S-ribosylhomocysteine lyase LuxS involved in autoinducer biosynthesis
LEGAVPGVSVVECGNSRDNNLEGAKKKLPTSLRYSKTGQQLI